MALVLVATLAAAAQTVPRALVLGPDGYCEVARASFERTSKWARDLAATLEGLDTEGPEATASRLTAIRAGLEQEGVVLRAHTPPEGAEDIRARGVATVDILVEIANPGVVDIEEEAREELAALIRDQFIAARGEARAAAASLRQQERHCPSRRAPSGVWQLLRRGG